MNQPYKKILGASFECEPRKDLSAKIANRIRVYETRRLRLRIAFSGSVSVLAVVAIIPALGYLAEAISQSNFLTFASLAFSDSAYFFQYFGDIVLAMISSWPVIETIALVAAVLMGAYGLNRIASDMASFKINRSFGLPIRA